MRDRLPMIFSITALLVALFGITPLGEAAYNAVVPRNSVGTLQLQRNAVKAAKIAPNAIRSGHVLDGTLLAADFKPGQIPQGPKGDQGDKGPKGDKGDPATALWANVAFDGSLRGSKGVASASHAQTGIYEVTFDQDPSKCAIFGQPNLNAGNIGWSTSDSAGNAIRMSIFTTPVGTYFDAPFSVAVFC